MSSLLLELSAKCFMKAIRNRGDATALPVNAFQTIITINFAWPSAVNGGDRGLVRGPCTTIGP